MTRRREGPSRKQKAAAASRLLSALLRSPKTRPGLIAAASSQGVSKHYVYGYLSEATRIGAVTTIKSGVEPLYQLTEFVVIEQPTPSDFPDWLEPRVVPASVSRSVYIDARVVTRHALRQEQ